MTKKNKNPELDSVYFLKILMFFILGSLWLRSNQELLPAVTAVPVGLMVGLLFAHHDHFQIDRKIEYAILLAAAVLSFVAPIGVVLQI